MKLGDRDFNTNLAACIVSANEMEIRVDSRET